jgi:hypothetical protein
MGKAFGDDGMGAALFVAEFGPTEDGADDIVEIVSDAAGKLTDALEFLRLEQLAFADVTRRARGARRDEPDPRRG